MASSVSKRAWEGDSERDYWGTRTFLEELLTPWIDREATAQCGSQSLRQHDGSLGENQSFYRKSGSLLDLPEDGGDVPVQA